MAKAAKKRGQRMKRISVYLDTQQIEALAELQRTTGVPAARVIRDGVDRELEARGVKIAGRGPRRTSR